MQIPLRLTLSVLRCALVLVAHTVVAQGVASACSIGVRPATAEEQRFYADAFAAFQKAAPAAPAGWTATDDIHPGASNGVLREVCARPNERVHHALFRRSYKLAGQEAAARQAALERKLAALMQEQQAATNAGKPVNWEAFDAAKAKAGAEFERDSSAEFGFSVGHERSISDSFSPVPVPVGKGYRQAYARSIGVPHQDLVIVLNPGTPAKSGLKVVTISGDPARVEALLKAATLR